jgi:hypothetical protein
MMTDADGCSGDDVALACGSRLLKCDAQSLQQVDGLGVC